jgi:hypothetical protein
VKTSIREIDMKVKTESDKMTSAMQWNFAMGGNLILNYEKN